MKKIMDGKVVETTSETKIATRTNYNSQNNPLSYESINRVGDIYYYGITGAGDIWSPDNDIEEIGFFSDMIVWAEENGWACNAKLIEHIEEHA